MSVFRCTSYFCKWNKGFGVCSHPQSIEALEANIPNPVAGCECYEKFSLRRKISEKNKRKAFKEDL